jgi:ATP-binding cassette subfamily B protein
MFEYVLDHSHQFFSDQFAGSIGSKISRMADATLSIITIFLSIFWPVLVAFCISIAILYRAKPLFGFLLLGWCILHFSITLLFVRKTGIKSSLHSESVTLLNGKIIDAISNIANIRLFSRKKYEMQYLSNYQNDEVKCSSNLIYYNSIMKLVLAGLRLVSLR